MGLWVEDGKLFYQYNLFMIERTRIASSAPLPAGKVKSRSSSRYSGTGHVKAIDVVIRVNGSKIETLEVTYLK